MALIATQQCSITGIANVTFSAAAGGGDTVTLAPRALFWVKNASGGSITVTVVVPGNTVDGQAMPDVAVVVAAGNTAAIGPFDSHHVDPTLGTVGITYSGVTSLTVAYVSA